jgi:nucleotide-binding universal stress UspA family protein
MFDTILIGLDGTPEAAASLPLAASLAQGRDTTLVLVQVCDGAAEDAPSRIAAHDYLSTFAAGLIVQGFDVVTEIGSGDPATALVAAAARYEADLIMLVTHGRQGLARVWHGSVTAAVIAASPVPILVLRADATSSRRLQTILVPLDDAPGNTAALDVGRLLARATAATIVLLRVIPPLPRLGDRYGADRSWEVTMRCGAESMLDLLVLGLHLEGVRARGQVAIGLAAPTIGEVAGEIGADLVVMGTRGPKETRRALFGSVADTVVRTTNRPVLLIREHHADTTGGANGDILDRYDEARPDMIPQIVSTTTAPPRPEAAPGSGADTGSMARHT